MAAFAARRPTRDLDFCAAGFSNDIVECEQRIRAVAAIDIDDGLVFDQDSVRGETIRDEADYVGVRVRLQVRIATARIALHTDLSFGDPIWPAPTMVELPRLFGGTVALLGYPDHMVLAEKIVTAMERGAANTRWRDFVDIDALANARAIDAGDLARAVETVASHRQVALRPLSTVLADMAAAAQPRWLAWRRKQHLEDSTPEAFSDLLERCAQFADRAILDSVDNLTWNPGQHAWL